MKKFFITQKGFGLVEVMIGFAILGVGTFIALQGIDFIDKKKVLIDREATQEGLLTGLIESIRINIAMEKIDFNAENFLQNTTYDAVHSSLQLCWVHDGIIPLETFPQCPGRIGYVVTPLKMGPLELRGLYKVTVRMTHAELYPNTFKQYEFIVKDP